MENLNYILSKYGVKDQKSPIKLWCSRSGTLPKLFKELGFKIGTEVGVYKGRFSKTLVMNNPALKLYCVDPWKTYEGHQDIEPQNLMDIHFLETKARLAPYNCQLIRDWSMSAVKEFADESLDFIYIDANHEYKYVKEDIREWSKKVRKGGIVAGHDYVNEYGGVEFGVKQAVDEWIIENNISPLFLLIKRDKCPSWFYVKGEK